MVYTFINFEDLDLDRQTDWMVATWERIRRSSYFRLLGDQVRSKIVHMLQHKAMYMQELTNLLELNPGTVSRNLNNLSNAHLLEKEIRGDRYDYRTNLDYIRTVFRHMLDYYGSHGQL